MMIPISDTSWLSICNDRILYLKNKTFKIYWYKINKRKLILFIIFNINIIFLPFFSSSFFLGGFFPKRNKAINLFSYSNKILFYDVIEDKESPRGIFLDKIFESKR